MLINTWIIIIIIYWLDDGRNNFIFDFYILFENIQLRIIYVFRASFETFYHKMYYLCTKLFSSHFGLVLKALQQLQTLPIPFEKHFNIILILLQYNDIARGGSVSNSEDALCTTRTYTPYKFRASYYYSWITITVGHCYPAPSSPSLAPCKAKCTWK